MVKDMAMEKGDPQMQRHQNKAKRGSEKVGTINAATSIRARLRKCDSTMSSHDRISFNCPSAAHVHLTVTTLGSCAQLFGALGMFGTRDIRQSRVHL